MRVSHSLPTAGIGLAVLAAFGFAGQSRSPQAKVTPPVQSGQLAPTEHITVEPTLFTWSDLLKVQASLPERRGPVIEQQVPLSPDLPLIDLPLGPVSQESFFPHTGTQSLALCPGYVAEPPLGKTFDGQLDVPDGAGFSFIPPDVTGSVGPNHVMTMLNNKTLIQNRLGGAPVVVDTSVFWSPLGATPLAPTNTFHRVNYDGIDGRWIATCRNGSGAGTAIFFAISATNNPTGLDLLFVRRRRDDR
jgi:hypothetical protein